MTWDRIKAAEKGIAHEPDKLSPKLTKYSRTLPPLMAASKISAQALGNLSKGIKSPDFLKAKTVFRAYFLGIANKSPEFDEKQCLGNSLIVPSWEG